MFQIGEHCLATSIVRLMQRSDHRLFQNQDSQLQLVQKIVPHEFGTFQLKKLNVFKL
jgi:hypothetical protein